MSADNTVVILEYKDGYKVKEIGAVENLVYGVKKGWLNLPKLVWYFGNTKFTKNKCKAYNIAESICNNHFVEYGVMPVKCNLTWNAIIHKAYNECKDVLKDSLIEKYDSKEYKEVIEICKKYWYNRDNHTMTVKRIINELKKYDPKSKVMIPCLDELGNNYDNNFLNVHNVYGEDVFVWNNERCVCIE